MPDTNSALWRYADATLQSQDIHLTPLSPLDQTDLLPDILPWSQSGVWYAALARHMQLESSNCTILAAGSRHLTGPLWQLALYRDFTGTQVKSLTNYYSPVIGPLAPGSTGQWQHFFSAMTKLQPACHCVQLHPLTETHYHQLQLKKIPGWGLHFSHSSDNWTAQASEYWQRRPSQLRNTIKRKRQKLFGLGARIDISCHISAEFIAAYWQVYQQSWKPAEPSKEFINTLLKATADNHSLRLGLVWLNEKPIAAQCWLVSNGVAAIFKLAQDQGYDEYSPGTVLTSALIDHVIQQDKVNSIDFLTGNDSYKAQWMDQCRPLYRVSAFRLSSPSALLRYLVLSAKEMLKRLRNQEPG